MSICSYCAKKKKCTKICPNLEKLLPSKNYRIRNVVHFKNFENIINNDKKIQNLKWRKKIRRMVDEQKENALVRDIEKLNRRYYTNKKYREKRKKDHRLWALAHLEYHKGYRKWRKEIGNLFMSQVSRRGNVLGRKKGSKDLSSRKKEGYFLRYAKNKVS